MPTYRLTIAYDGARFHGYARQPRVRTVQGELEACLEPLVGPVETSVAGRTDKGVHASGQVVAVTSEQRWDLDRVVRSVNKRLGPEVAILEGRLTDAGFSARFEATERAYVYRILNRDAPDPFLAATSWHVTSPLDIDRMNVAAKAFLGEQDFTSLCRRAGDRSNVRHVRTAVWSRHGDMVRFDVAASSFCHQMVRSMVALCVDVGRGKVEPESVPDVLAARDRHAARGVAPPHGLTLVRVEYG